MPARWPAFARPFRSTGRPASQLERAPEISPDVAGWRRARMPRPPQPREPITLVPTGPARSSRRARRATTTSSSAASTPRLASVSSGTWSPPGGRCWSASSRTGGGSSWGSTGETRRCARRRSRTRRSTWPSGGKASGAVDCGAGRILVDGDLARSARRRASGDRSAAAADDEDGGRPRSEASSTARILTTDDAFILAGAA